MAGVPPAPPLPADLPARVRAETFVDAVEVHPTLGSTNDRALALAAAGPPSGPPPGLPLLVVAGRQTAGRGRGGHRWAAPAGCLTFTLLLEMPGKTDRADAADPAALAPLVGLTVAEAAAALTPRPVAVKWPNDVLARVTPAAGGAGRAGWGKAAGVLCEAPRAGLLAVGVGLNLNVHPADLPPGLPTPPATLRPETDDGTPAPPHDPAAVLCDLLVRLEAALSRFAAAGGVDPARWAARDALAGRPVTVTAGRTTIAGTACGVTPGGALRVFDGAGVREVRTGTVAWE